MRGFRYLAKRLMPLAGNPLHSDSTGLRGVVCTLDERAVIAFGQGEDYSSASVGVVMEQDLVEDAQQLDSAIEALLPAVGDLCSSIGSQPGSRVDSLGNTLVRYSELNLAPYDSSNLTTGFALFATLLALWADSSEPPTTHELLGFMHLPGGRIRIYLRQSHPELRGAVDLNLDRSNLGAIFGGEIVSLMHVGDLFAPHSQATYTGDEYSGIHLRDLSSWVR